MRSPRAVTSVRKNARWTSCTYSAHFCRPIVSTHSSKTSQYNYLFKCHGNPLDLYVPKFVTRTTGGTEKNLEGYAAENKLLKTVAEFRLLSY